MRSHSPDTPHRQPPPIKAVAVRRPELPDPPVYLVDPPGHATLGGVLELLWLHRWLVGSASLIAGLLAVTVAYLERPIYEARTSIEIQMPNDDYMNRRQLNPVLEPGVLLLEPYLLTQQKLIESDTMLLAVIRKLHLVSHPEFNPEPGLIDRLKQRWDPQPEGPPSDQMLLDMLRDGLTVRLMGETQLLEILYESPDPELAKQVVDALAAESIRSAADRMSTSTTETASYLAAQVNELGQAAQQAQGKLAAFVSANQWLEAGAQESVAETRLRQLQTTLGEAQAARIASESRYEMVRTASDEQLTRELDSDTLKAYRVQLTELRQRLAEDIQVLKPAHYKVRQTEAEIKELEEAFARERAGILARLKSEFEAARFREDALREEYRQQSELVAAQTGLGLRYDALKHDVETSRQLYDSVLQKVKEAGLASAMLTGNVDVVDQALLPEDPISPNKKLYALGGLAGGFTCGMVYVFISDRRNPLSPAGGPRVPMPLLGSISPHAQGPRRTRRIVNYAPGAGVAPDLEDLPEFTTWRDRHSQTAATFRGLLDELVGTEGAAGNRSRIITVTSACPREGRTMICCNVATALAETGKRVLLVDADGVRPRLHQVFRVPDAPGLSDLMLAQIARRPVDLESALWVTYVPGLCILPAGSRPETLAGLATQPGTAAFFEVLRGEFDVVLVDTPAVLDGEGAKRFGALSDGVAVVVRSGATSPDLVDEAVRELGMAGVNFVGAISNRFFAEEEATA